ncbi:MAG: type III pantothenate kinase [Bacteroidales bacterium]
MVNFLIDIGNSNSKVAFEENGKIGEIAKNSELDILSFILSVIKETSINIIVLSNVREDDANMERVLKRKCKKLIVLNNTTKLPVNLKYGFSANTLGADRIAAALAIAMLFPNKDCIKFDFGTALTIDYIDKNGEYKGGNISLGLQSRFKALNAFTKRLPLINPDTIFPEIGTTTTGAITAGVVLGLIFEVEGYIKKSSNYTVIFTGGDAFYFAKKLKNTIFVVQNLVLIGLAQIADYYADCNKN